ncbi:hypothetical protein K7X08_003264 [Anisodus acutangulus]|uniref:Uncharacterized protein n=1 Tax=Anisodus acutangulus TaxID=402998 RepID=A0A9Q1RI40_9SOLA|nr:hypothetical protein K7X08_003264 [Anisodus acutangulus]
MGYQEDEEALPIFVSDAVHESGILSTIRTTSPNKVLHDIVSHTIEDVGDKESNETDGKDGKLLEMMNPLRNHLNMSSWQPSSTDIPKRSRQSEVVKRENS